MNKRRILIVDDEPKVAFFFQQHLDLVDENYQAKAVNSGAAALEELQHNDYDLMITDLRMPQMDGIELLRRVKQISPTTKTILVTAYGSEEVWEEARRLEIFRSLSKPLKIPDLLTSVREAFSTPRPQLKRGVLALTGENFEELSKTIEALRVDVGAQTVVVADTTGRILTDTGHIESFYLDSMLALLGGTMAASCELAHQLKYPQPLFLSHFEGPPYDLFAANLGNDFFLTIILSRHKGASRIGVVWLYTRRVLQKVIELLGQERMQPTLEDGFAENVQSELDNLFGDSPTSTAPKVEPVNPTKKQTAAPPARFSQEISSILSQFGQQTGLVVEKRLDALDQPLSPTAVNLTLRTISSGLKNIHQHANASIIGVSFNSDEENLYGRIVDDGIGFNNQTPPELGGLKNLKETFKRLGGSLELSAYPNQGTTLAITLPLKTR
jgi:CheY-like chemotaxis protein